MEQNTSLESKIQNSKHKALPLKVFHEILNSRQNSKQETNLDDPDFVGHIQSIIVWSQPHICLLSPIRPDQGIDFLCLNVIHLLHGSLDLLLISFDVHNENKGVVVFNLLHCRLGGERIL
uniref:Uncharacterized protein n=1 Tax=Spongospora subterranea TaxID=70186 RepID=A0A0H5QGF3_9EUKA|eukprot:CRZ01030.1 hypothetical protein [Spongospora subterranea]